MPFGHFFFKQLDLWHGQGHFFQVGLLIIFALSFFEKPKPVQILNKSLGVFTLWTGLTTSYLWATALTKTGQYPIKIFMTFFNVLCFLLFYKLVIEYLDEEKIKKILIWFRYTIIMVLFYCTLQYLKLDEFLKGLSSHDELVGTIGNPSHLAGYLAIVQPIFFNKKGIIPLILLWSIILLSNSASGVFVGLLVILFWLFINKKYRYFFTILILGIISLVIVFIRFNSFFCVEHRFEMWKLLFETFKNKAVTGFGLGTFGALKITLPPDLTIWRHVHNEFYQIAFETGLVGLGLVFWCIWEYFKEGFKLIKSNTCLVLLTMFFGICLLSLFSFPIHLWQISAIGMIAYSGIYCIKNYNSLYKNEVNNA